MSQTITIKFHQALNDFLPVDHRSTEFTHELKKTRSVKDLIESIGVPHTEVDVIIVNDKSVDFSYLVQHGGHIDVFPAMNSSDIEQLSVSPLTHNQPPTLQPPRFVLDVHLGRLAGYLRMLGFDCLYRNDYDDPELAAISADENRILLTCDRRLLMRKQVEYGYFVHARQPKQQLQEVLSHFALYDQVQPFGRCMHCNGRILTVAKNDIEEQLLEKTKKYHDEFFRCDSCQKIYWEGSHYDRMKTMIDDISSAGNSSVPSAGDT
jgi:uncharacterized protein with PIN domain